MVVRVKKPVFYATRIGRSEKERKKQLLTVLPCKVLSSRRESRWSFNPAGLVIGSPRTYHLQARAILTT